MSGNDTNTEYNPFPSLNAELLASYVGAFAVILCVVTVFIKLVARPRVVVNCWFCNTNSRVPSKEANNWLCSHCEQYNGFLPNGDYNRDIPEQRLGSGKDVFAYNPKASPLETNGLCNECNDKQDLKIKHLASFQAVVPSNYDEELTIYRNQLENAYRLCKSCETVVSQVLEKKKSLVLGMQLQQSGKRTKATRQYFKYRLVGAYRALATGLCMATAAASPLLKDVNIPMLSVIQELVELNYPLVLAALTLMQFLLTVSTSRKLPLVVCLVHVGMYFVGSRLNFLGDQSHVLSVLSGLTLALTLCSKKSRTSASAFVKMKKLNKSPISTKELEKERKSCSLEEEKREEEESAMKGAPSLEESRGRGERLSRPCSSASIAGTGPQDDNSSVDSAFSTHDSLTQDGDSVRGDLVREDSVRGDVDSLIESLSAWDSRVLERSERPERPERPRRPAPSSRHEFQSRQYKPVLNPPRLVSTSPKSVNESSWVAGGFWQNHQNDSERSPSRPASLPGSRPGSPNLSVYSQASSASVYESPSTPTPPMHYPMYYAYGPPPPNGPPNGFQQPFGFQPYMYPGHGATPMWNSPLYQGPPVSGPVTPSSASCSSASTCGSVWRRDRFSDVHSGHFSVKQPPKNFWESLWNNSSVILYTSAFYVALSAIAIFVYRKW